MRYSRKKVKGTDKYLIEDSNNSFDVISELKNLKNLIFDYNWKINELNKSFRKSNEILRSESNKKLNIEDYFKNNKELIRIKKKIQNIQFEIQNNNMILKNPKDIHEK